MAVLIFTCAAPFSHALFDTPNTNTCTMYMTAVYPTHYKHVNMFLLCIYVSSLQTCLHNIVYRLLFAFSLRLDFPVLCLIHVI